MACGAPHQRHEPLVNGQHRAHTWSPVIGRRIAIIDIEHVSTRCSRSSGDGSSAGRGTANSIPGIRSNAGRGTDNLAWDVFRYRAEGLRLVEASQGLKTDTTTMRHRHVVQKQMMEILDALPRDDSEFLGEMLGVQAFDKRVCKSLTKQ